MEGRVKLLGIDFKAALSRMRFPGAGGQGASSTSLSLLEPSNYFLAGYDSWASARSGVDYASEIGSLGQSSLVMAAVNWLGRVLPEAPLIVAGRETGTGKENKIENHPATQLFKRPNPYYTGSTLFKQFAYSWIIDGNVYLLKVRNGGKQVTELWYVPPSMIQPRWPKNGTEFISHYEYKVDAQTFDVDVEDVIHFGDGRDYSVPSYGRCGISPLKSLLREIYSDAEIANYSAALMKNGAIPPIILSLKDGTSSVKFDPKALKDAYQRATQGAERGKAFVSNQAIDVHKVAFNPSEMDLKALRRLPEERLAAVIGIPAIVLGFGAGLDKATYANAEQLTEFATETYLVPLWRYIEEELSHQLLPEFDAAGSLTMHFDMHKVRALSEDEDKLYSRLSMAYKEGWLKRSEVRAKAGFEFDKEDEVYKVETTPAQLADPNADPNAAPNADPVVDQSKPAEKKAASDEMLDAAVPWLLKLDEAEAAELLQARTRVNGRG